MLYILYKGNHNDLSYRGGQKPMVHLVFDLDSIVQWAEKNKVHWTFSDSNAGGYLARFFKRREDLDQVNWEAVNAADFQHPVIKEGKQAEFLVFDSVPWTLVEKIGVYDAQTAQQTIRALGPAGRPPVEVRREWYY